MSKKTKEIVILRAIHQIDGAMIEHAKCGKEISENDYFWQDMGWLCKWLDQYEIGYDRSRDLYLVRYLANNEETVIGGIKVLKYQNDDARMIRIMIKAHKKDLKEDMV